MSKTDTMLVRFWGVRGSLACPGPDTVRSLGARREEKAITSKDFEDSVDKILLGVERDELINTLDVIIGVVVDDTISV